MTAHKPTGNAVRAMPGQRRDYRVLLIEDCQAEADLILAMFTGSRDFTFCVDHVQRYLEGMARLDDDIYDAVLLDLNLPDSSGLGGFERVHQLYPTLPVIILTNYRDEELALRAVREGAQDYLVKNDVDHRLLSRSLRYAIERAAAEAALLESEERYSLAIRGAQDVIWDWHLINQRSYFSPRLKAILGYGEDELGDDIQEWFTRVHPEDHHALRAALQDHIDGGSAHFEHEHRLITASGQYIWVLSRGLAIRDSSGAAYRIAGSLTDITRRKLAEERLLHDTLHDALTQLPNRVLFMDRLNQALRHARRDGQMQFAVLFFDLDRFKIINDSLGHAVGDELLIAVGRRLEKFLRPGDTLARLGGDEFAILLHGIDGSQGATHVADRIHDLFRQRFTLRDHEVFTSASIGVALHSAAYEQAEEILRDADLAMYRAKRSGSDGCAISDNGMHQRALETLRTEAELRWALERNELVMHYQPIICMHSGRVRGFEALLRWQHPQRGLIYPDAFIRVAEDTGLIIPIGWWALREACARLREWQRLFPMDPPIAVSVNISGRLFGSPDVGLRIAELLREHDLPPSSLHLEITESVIMDHGETTMSALAYLRQMGVQLHIDDFGTGYSSLSYLQRFSYDSLKIDRSFVMHMNEKSDSNAIVKTLVALGDMLGMRVIAEGVETQEQFQELKAMRCPEAQGYWFARPMQGADVEPFLARGPVAVN
jgi:diguanylate cyclase (GGDEF)-like protein/PAS domain S-box-containing protein